MNVLMAFCAYMAVVYVPWDFFMKPVEKDAEVWFGFMLHGWAAKATEPLHWLIYAAGAYGFWRMKRWMWPWASLYVAQIAVAALVWNVVYQRGWVGGVVAFAVIGAVALALWRARAHFQPPLQSLRNRHPGWALVTGASAGIGAEFARKLAARGYPLVLSARRQERLRALALELEKDFGVATRVVAVDLAAEAGPQQVADAVADLEIGVLVNNAGFGLAGRFDGQDAARLREMVLLNCVAPTILTSLLLPGMKARRQGAILFTGSIAGRQPLPLHAVYAATKGYDLLLGEALWAELREHGIDVLVLEPGSTESEFHAVANELPHPAVPAGPVVDAALEALGRQPSLIVEWGNWLRANALRLGPRSLVALLAKRVVSESTPPELR
jgi:short-subunit dehydrogenase